MKKILKGIGIFILSIGVLLPFIDVKNVKAQEDNCTNHLQKYYFLDDTFDLNYYNSTGATDTKYSGYDKGYTTYTTFPFLFPLENNEVTVTNVTIDNFDYENNKDEIINFYDIYLELEAKDKEATFENGDFGYFVIEDKTPTEKYTTTTYFSHGFWGRLNANGKPIDSKGNIEDKIKGGDDSYNLTHQSKSDIRTKGMQVTLSGARFEKDESTKQNVFKLLDPQKDTGLCDSSSCYVTKNETNQVNGMVKYLNYLINNTDEAKTTRNYMFRTSNDSTTYNFAVMINRKLNTRYDLTSTTRFWPVVMEVEYKSCTIQEEYWNLVYDINTTDNVKNIPNDGTAKVNESLFVQDGPIREGYAFKKWCEDKEGKGKCYDPGYEYNSSVPQTITLYAQWADTSEGEQKKTGIVSYIISFVAVGMIAGTVYLVSSKKNLFKQI